MHRERQVKNPCSTKKRKKTEDSWSKSGDRHHEEPRLKLHNPDNETFPDPIQTRRRSETTSVEQQTVNLKLWPMTYGPKRRVSIFPRNGSGLQGSRSYVDLLKDTSVWMEDLRKSKDYQTSKWPDVWISFSKNQKEQRLHNGPKKMPNCKQHAETHESTRYWLMLVRNWKRILFLLCRALWGNKVEGNLRPVQLQLKPARNSQIQKHMRACRNVKRTHTDHSAKKGYVGSCHYGLVHKSLFKKLRRNQESKPPWKNIGMKWRQLQLGMSRKWDESQEIICQAKKYGKTRHFAIFEGPLSPEASRPCKKPSRNTRSDFVLQRDNVTDEEGCRAIFTEQALQRLRWQWQSSWKLSQSFQVWLEKQVTQVQRALKSKWPKLPDCYDCHMKHVLRCGSGFLHDKDQTVGMIFKTPWYLLKRIFIWSLVSGPSLGKKNLKKCNVKREVNKCQYGNAFTITKSSDYFYRFMWRCTKMLERSRAWDPYGNFGKKKSTSKIKRFS